MGTSNKLKIEITFGSDDYYHVDVNGEQFKMCCSYKELSVCIGSLIKSCCNRREKYEVGYN